MDRYIQGLFILRKVQIIIKFIYFLFFYILGLALIREKYLNEVFGTCPRIVCGKQTVLPIGLSNDFKYARVKVFCPRCNEIYNAKIKQSQMDGAYFGLSFPQEFLMVKYKSYI